MEMIVLIQTHREPESVVKDGDFSLDDLPLGLKIARPRKLEEEARKIFEEMVKYHGTAHISSANLMTTMGSLTNIARARPTFMPRVVTALEMLQANLPPTLAKSQVSSVRKHLKNQLLALLRHPTAAEHFFTNMTTLLTDLGASRDEVMRAIPNYEEMKRKARKKEREAEKAKEAEREVIESKRPKIDIPDEEEEEEEDESSKQSRPVTESAVDITERFVFSRLQEPGFAVELVLASMSSLPSVLPPHFNNTYTPIAAAGTEGQVKHVSRLLATQLTSAGLGPGVNMVTERTSEEKEEEDEEMPAAKISTVVGRTTTDPAEEKPAAVKLVPAGLTTRKSKSGKVLKLSEVTKPLSLETRQAMILAAVKRILGAEKSAVVGGVPGIRSKIIANLAASLSMEIKSALLEFIFQDLSSRADLAFSWLFEEYCVYQGFNRSAGLQRQPGDDTSYNDILCSLIKGVSVTQDLSSADRENILRRLYLESPIITDDAIALLKQFCQGQAGALVGVSLMKDLVMLRPTKQLNFLHSILEFCSHQDPAVRDTALNTLTQLHGRGDSSLSNIIEDYSVMYLKFLLLARPPDMLFGEDRGRPEVVTSWAEDIIRVCLHLYLAILPTSHKLLSHLAEVYIEASGDIKRTILRTLETPIREIGMDSPELLSLVENCPKGSETLVTGIIRILTERQAPSADLVNRVRDLYAKRVADVRFLVPVLNGLTKQEIYAALPKLIKLNTAVVKEVFNRLLGTGMAAPAPLSPPDLMIALHNIEPAKCDMKTVIKATGICFQDKSVFTMEVLTIVLQQLMEQKDIPLLLMRTVIQSVALYPNLIGFTMNILQRLIVKQVWKQKMLWEGFIKCCERTRPQSFRVLLQLPPAQLRLLLEAAPDMREPLLEQVQGFNESQRQHVPATIMQVLYNVTQSDTQEPDTEQTAQ